MSDSSKLRCAAIGVGGIGGHQHARAYQKNPQAELVAVADINPAAMEKFHAELAPEMMFADHHEMLKKAKPDLVSIALPNSLHAPVAIDCLKAGAHVLCEKPMAMNLREAREMQAAAEENGKRLGINLSFRFTEQARSLKRLADEGMLGQPYHANTRWTRRRGLPGFGGWFGQKKLSGGGPLIDLGVHRLDLALWLMGSPKVVSVSGTTHHLRGVPLAKASGKAFDVEDYATGFVRLENNISLVFEMSWVGHQHKREDMYTCVTGTNGSLFHYNQGHEYDFVAEFICDQAGSQVNGRVEKSLEACRDPYDEMVHCILNDEPYLVSPEDGIRIQQILDGLYQSAEEGREVAVE